MILAKPEGHRDSDYLIHTIIRQQITVLQLVPTQLRMLLATTNLERCQSLRMIFCGGEILPTELVTAFQQQLPQTALYNLYGPSEATIDTTYWHCTSMSIQTSISIGRPIANTQVYILDRHCQLVPIGVSGELHISGIGIAQSYLNHPDSTAEKFVPHPFSLKPGTRLYKAGDLTRYWQDGTIEYIGRSDNQIKLRGFRIELGEIEQTLVQHPKVQEGVVVARQEAPDTRLIAYVVPHPASALTTTEVFTFLQERLPDYMWPSVLLLDALPLTPNGKVDRHALPVPAPMMLLSDTPCVAPRTMIEMQLVQIWEDILQHKPIGVTDNFFALGGHSLMIFPLIQAIQHQFQQALPVNQIFQHPTIEQLALHLQQEQALLSVTTVMPLQPGGPHRPFFLIPPISGDTLCYATLVHELAPDRPYYGLPAPGLYDQQEPLRRMEDLATYYLQLVRQVQPMGPYLLGGWSLGGLIAFEMARQLVQAGHYVDPLILIDCHGYAAANTLPPVNQASLILHFVQDLTSNRGAEWPIDINADTFLQLHYDEQIATLVTYGKQLKVLAPTVNAAQLKARFEVYRAHYEAFYDYRPQPYAGNVVLLYAQDTQRRSTTAPSGAGLPVATDKLTTVVVPGDHYTIMTHPQVLTLAEQLQSVLNEKCVK